VLKKTRETRIVEKKKNETTEIKGVKKRTQRKGKKNNQAKNEKENKPKEKKKQRQTLARVERDGGDAGQLAGRLRRQLDG